MECEHKETKIIETPDSIHYGKEICKDCEKYIKFVTNPKNEDKRNKTSKYSIRHILKFHNKEKEICFFCLRTKEKLGTNETMTIDHIEEIKDGGEDELGNLQILCFACHKLKNWIKLYFNDHLEKFYKKEEDNGEDK